MKDLGEALVWTYHNPVSIHFGVGEFGRIANLIGDRAYAVVTYGDAYFRGLVEQLADKAGPAVLIIDTIAPNPDFITLGAASHAMVAAQRPEVIVAIGGGSVLDAAKVLAVGELGFDAVREHLDTDGASESLPATAIPLIAVPTTAGTGSEVTSWATVWDTENAKKYSLARNDLYPTHAVIDPELMRSLPLDQTISTGLDALSHALESIWNINLNPVSANFAVSAAKSVMQHLVPLSKNLDDLVLRTHMAEAATTAGLAFSNTRTALAHSLSYPVTLHHGVPHGVACSFMLPDVMRSAVGASAACDETLKRVFGEDLDAGVDQLTSLLSDLGIDGDPGSFGVTSDDWNSWINDAIDGARGKNFIGHRDRVQEVFNRAGPESRQKTAV
jgi:phosphonate metabolism-associated iron-containing alcohol dehydrogenase